VRKMTQRHCLGWSIAHSKTVVRVTVPRVRIPPSPPFLQGVELYPYDATPPHRKGAGRCSGCPSNHANITDMLLSAKLLFHCLQAKIEGGDVQGLGLPSFIPGPQDYITQDCIQP
jgi:hypothetical protein